MQDQVEDELGEEEGNEVARADPVLKLDGHECLFGLQFRDVKLGIVLARLVL